MGRLIRKKKVQKKWQNQLPIEIKLSKGYKLRVAWEVFVEVEKYLIKGEHGNCYFPLKGRQFQLLKDFEVLLAKAEKKGKKVIKCKGMNWYDPYWIYDIIEHLKTLQAYEKLIIIDDSGEFTEEQYKQLGKVA